MQKYSYNNKELDVSIDCYLDDNNDIWFRGRDIAIILDYKNPQKAIKDHVLSDDRILRDHKISINSRCNKTVPRAEATDSRCNKTLPRAETTDSRCNKTLPRAETTEKTFKCFFINESGFYSLILSSKKQEAVKFKHWVTSKVLPSIRKQGYYNQFNDRNNNMLMIESEDDLHYKIVSFIRKKYEGALMVAGLGENQISPNMRIRSYKKGYMAGQCDLMLMNPTRKHSALCLEFKSPTGVYKVSDKQSDMKLMYEKNNCKYIMSNSFEDLIHEITKHMEESKLYLSRRERYLKK